MDNNNKDSKKVLEFKTPKNKSVNNDLKIRSGIYDNGAYLEVEHLENYMSHASIQDYSDNLDKKTNKFLKKRLLLLVAAMAGILSISLGPVVIGVTGTGILLGVITAGSVVVITKDHKNKVNKLKDEAEAEIRADEVLEQFGEYNKETFEKEKEYQQQKILLEKDYESLNEADRLLYDATNFNEKNESDHMSDTYKEAYSSESDNIKVVGSKTINKAKNLKVVGDYLNKEQSLTQIKYEIEVYDVNYDLPPINISEQQLEIYFDTLYDFIHSKGLDSLYYSSLSEVLKFTFAKALNSNSKEITIYDLLDNLYYLQGGYGNHGIGRNNVKPKELKKLKSELTERLQSLNVVAFEK